MTCKSIRRLFLLGLLAGCVPLVCCVLLGCSRDTPSRHSTSDTGTSDTGVPSSSVIQGDPVFSDDEEQHVDGKQDADGGFTHVLTVETEYYLGGPQQARPPDGQFTAGLKVKLIEQAGSYFQVESESGVTAYIAADALQRIEDETGN